MSDCPGRVLGSRKSRGDLARKMEKETAKKAMHCMHLRTFGFMEESSHVRFYVVTDKYSI